MAKVNMSQLCLLYTSLAGCGVLWGFRTGDELCGAGASYLVRSPEDIRMLVLDA